MVSETLFLDSNVYIHALRSPFYERRIESFLSGAYLYVINKIVLMELWAGIQTTAEETVLHSHQGSFPLIGLTDDNFIAAGQVMLEMKKNYKLAGRMRRQLTWDILIALSAKENRSVILTENKRDFERIRKFIDFDFIAIKF